ncbi:peroxisome biogenesis factor 1 [Trichonephila clavata]|uniref:Peroxisomal ATPase PEX1 n=1 Tax=Trichonephila clavata TaxID=2740835 RepID=A0A8X6G100_TRICU|nr:peroxisome biogenesis factor 1 [Trichonephila clavata]
MIETATVKFASVKWCFISVPDYLLKESLDIHVFKLFYGDNKTAFVSCLPYKPKDKNVVEILINAKYAEKLDLKENEHVCLESLPENIPAAQGITLEPLTYDDWEILELNAKNIEGDLMNQIRVVWKDQIFPVWVNNSSFYIKVVQTCPTSQPLLLTEFSELHIVPKCRPDAKNPEDSPGKKTPSHLQFQHLRTRRHSSIKSTPRSSDSSGNSETKSSISFPFSLLSSFFPGTGEVKDQHLNDSYSEFVPMNLDFILRVVPYSRPQVRLLPRVVQATTVFISASTYAEIYGANEIPPCFVAVLQKFSLPESDRERKLLGTHQQKSSKDLKTEHSSDSSFNMGNKIREEISKNKSSGLTEERPSPFQSVCVTVMVVKSSEEDEFSLPPNLFYSQNLIVIPKELKRCLNLEVSSLVYLSSVQSKPTSLNTIVVHPVISLSLNVTNEIISTNFQNWAFGNNREDALFVISDGTLVRLRLFGKPYDFFISLKENSNQTFNSSYSSVSSTSPVTSETDQKKSNSLYPKYGYLSVDKLQEIQVISGSLMCLSIQADRPYLQKSDGLYQEIPALHLDALGGINQLVEEALENLEFWLKLRPISYISNHSFTFSGCLLICGSKGIGKSVFATSLCKKLSKSHHVFVRIIHCLPLKGKRVDFIARKWNDIVIEAAYCQPSVILFEDLDYIAGSPISQEHEIGPDGIYFSNIVQTFINTMKRILSCNKRIAVIVTSQSTHSLHSNLVNTKGRHVFQKVIEIQPPNLEQRQEILKSLVLSKSHISGNTVDLVDWRNIASKTEGYVAQDLDSLVDRATHAAWVRMADSPGLNEIPLNLDDFQMALEGYVPSSLRGIPLQTHDYKTWNDVGGLEEIKKTIQQIIMWPIKYKQIFKSYSLKLQTNILLYGAPGTGKTLLAGVIANECGLNFISIKGPELLSKYIGASEQAIRDLFKRATSAKPCILFFDEFDSIAPRRGHDSTGVTDRVVNQLLTQLDGVESLEGVHVIAASSRPELIDPALLRPGRLDKCLLCPLPNERERLDILRCLSSKLSMSDDIDLEYIANRTEHFSGADLQALLYTANIEALHDTQSFSSRRYSIGGAKDLSYSVASDKVLYMPTIQDGLSVPTYEDGKKIIQEVSVIKENFCGIIERQGSRRKSTLSIVISQRNLLKVVDEMKPSVSPQERMRYEAVFRNFQGAASGDSAPTLIESIKRVTLA